METMIFIPYSSIGSIKFGESRDEVRKTLGSYREYKKNKFSANTLDDFGFCQVFYNQNNQTEAVEMYRNVEVIYKGVNLFNLNEDQLMDLLNDDNLKSDDYSLTSPTVGLSITLVDKLPDSILAYQKGYM